MLKFFRPEILKEKIKIENIKCKLTFINGSVHYAWFETISYIQKTGFLNEKIILAHCIDNMQTATRNEMYYDDLNLKYVMRCEIVDGDISYEDIIVFDYGFYKKYKKVSDIQAENLEGDEA